ncbi:MAG TPA: protein kinase [Candidatus Sulfomarinibacteraceae bacterium]|nr:protein kinase [Candidatus Sulfomarinibacteraceae bacterium]
MERIGHYEIVSELGRGGMGVVYKAHEASLNRFVAIKVLGEHLEGETEYVERFLREARSAASLSHPNIVQIYSVAEDAGHHYFVMEYVQGTNVQRMIQTRGKIPPAEAVRLLLQAAAGLDDAHNQGVIHRDIKPANLMVTERGLVKIADFGLALMGGATTRLTATGMLMGTPGYLSPEQCLDRPVDHRTDIYSLGVTFFEMLTGTMPFRADSPLALLKHIVETEPPDVRGLNPEVDETLRDIVSGMLAKDPDQRTASCSVLIDQLEAWLEARGERSAVAASRAAAAPGAPKIPPPPGSEDDINTQPTVAVASGASEMAASAPPPPPHPTQPAAVPAEAPVATAPPHQAPRASSRRGPLLIVAAVVVFFLAAAGVAAVLVAKSGVVERFMKRARPAVVQNAPSEVEHRATSPQTVGEEAAETDSGEPPPVVGAGPEAGTPGSRPGTAAAATGSLRESGAPRSSSDDSQPGGLPSTEVKSAAVPRESRSGDDAPAAAAAEPGPPVEALPPATATVVMAMGERLLAGEAEAYVKDRLAAAGVELVELTSVPGFESLFDTEQRPDPEQVREALRPYARYLVAIRVEYLGDRPIVVMGQRDFVHSARVRIGLVDLAEGRIVGGPKAVTVEYTQLNAERVVGDKLRRPATDLVQTLPRQ